MANQLNFFELYEFELQGYTWRYTNAQEIVNFGPNQYQPIPITRESLVASTDTNKGDIKIKLSVRSVLAQIIRWGLPVGDINIRITAINDDETILYTYPYLATQTAISVQDLTISAINESIVYKSKINSQKSSRTCIHNLYSSRCRVNKNNHFFETNLTRATGSTTIFVASPAPADPLLYLGGYIEYSFYIEQLNYSFTYRNDIIGINDNTLTLRKNDWLLTPLQTVKIYKGCTKEDAYCRDIFNNIANFGGQKNIPVANPNDGESF